MPEIYVWRVQCRPPLGCGTTAITEVRVYGPTYIFTCGQCGRPAAWNEGGVGRQAAGELPGV